MRKITNPKSGIKQMLKICGARLTLQEEANALTLENS